MKVLCGDIGGTKTRLALASVAGEQVALAQEATLASADHADFQSLVRKNRPAGDYTVACFGVAGPVEGGRVKTTNLPWELDAPALAADLGLEKVYLINDLEAFAWGIEGLGPEQFVVLQEGEPLAGGNQSVVAAGTGLGEAGRFFVGGRYIAFASEGGHADFAPSGPADAVLYEALAKTYGHVSWERVASGMGMPDLFRAVAALEGAAIPAWFEEAGAEAGAAIGRRAAAGDPLAHRTLERFFYLYGAEAGNHALKLNSRGGVFIGGGIAPRNLEWMRGGGFLEGFRAKGRMAPLMEKMPVKVILDDRAPLYGAALYAAWKHPR